MIDVAKAEPPAAAAGRNGSWQAREMKWQASELERTFRDCFFERYATSLEGGGSEPVYLPSSDPAREPHRIVYREDYFASALHEVAHWCLAGAARRALEDYGYWYRPDGRNLAEQEEFERAETRPQAVEWIFSDACGFPFHLSADNLSADSPARSLRADDSKPVSSPRGPTSWLTVSRPGRPAS